MKKEFNKILKQANIAISNLKLKEDDLLIFFQPYFDEEIAVLYQEADGFVILYNRDIEDSSHSNLNEGVEEVFENIMSDANFYRKGNT